MINMLIETFALWLGLCAVLALIAFKIRNMPIAMVSSLGLVIAGMRWYQDEADLFVLGMLWAIALVLPVSVGSAEKMRI